MLGTSTATTAPDSRSVSLLGVATPGVNEAFAVAPVALVLAQLPQVSQVRVSSTLSRTVVPGAGAGAGLDDGPPDEAVGVDQ